MPDEQQMKPSEPEPTARPEPAAQPESAEPSQPTQEDAQPAESADRDAQPPQAEQPAAPAGQTQPPASDEQAQPSHPAEQPAPERAPASQAQPSRPVEQPVPEQVVPEQEPAQEPASEAQPPRPAEHAVPEQASAEPAQPPRPAEQPVPERGSAPEAGADVDPGAEAPSLDEVIRERNGWRQLAADLKNKLKRTERDQGEKMIDAHRLFLDLLPVVDALERAVAEDTEDTAYRRGVELIHRQLLDVMTKWEVAPIEALGADFDLNLHEARFYEPADGRRDGEVVEELQRGYTLRGKLLRASMVKVAKA